MLARVTNSGSNQSRISAYVLFLPLFACFLILLAVRIGYRDISIGTDYGVYYSHYLNVSNSFEGPFEVGFQLLCIMGGWLGLAPETFFTFIALLQLGLMGWAFREISIILSDSRAQRLTIVFVTLIIFILWPFTWSAVTNVIRQGLAVPFLFLGVAFLVRREYAWSGLAFLLATMFHISSVVFALSCVLFVRFRRFAMAILALAILLYVLQLTDRVMMYIEMMTHIPVYSKVMEYGFAALYNAGYRYDFLAFSIAPILLLLIIRLFVGRRPTALSKIDALIGLYGAFLIPFLLLGYGAFSDRWLLPAWLLIPLFPGLVVGLFANKTPGLSLFSGMFLTLTALLTLLIRPAPLV